MAKFWVLFALMKARVCVIFSKIVAYLRVRNELPKIWIDVGSTYAMAAALWSMVLGSGPLEFRNYRVGFTEGCFWCFLSCCMESNPFKTKIYVFLIEARKSVKLPHFCFLHMIHALMTRESFTCTNSTSFSNMGILIVKVTVEFQRVMLMIASSSPHYLVEQVPCSFSLQVNKTQARQAL